MKKLATLTALFSLLLFFGAHFRNRNLDWDELFIEQEEGEYEEEHEDGPEEFVKYHQGIRTRSDEQKPGYPAHYQWTELQKAKEFSAARKSKSNARIEGSANGIVTFTERGPGNVPGRTRGLIVDPDDATHKTWYAGSAAGGVWKTTDAGSTWLWLTPTIPNMATACLAMAESNHNTIYAGTGEGFGLVDAVNGMGVIKTTNKGNTWTVLSSSFTFGSINRIMIDPSDDNNVFAAANSGIYHSTDGGSNWAKVYSGTVQDLRPTPGNFNILYGAEYGIGLIKSTDRGLNWVRSNGAMSPQGRVEIAVSPVKTDRIIASAQGTLSGGNSDLYLSDDGGVTWYLVNLTLANKTLNYLSSQGWYDNTVTFSPYNRDVVYVGGIGVYQITLGSPITSTTGNYSLNESGTTPFLSFVNFGASAYSGKLEIGSSATHDLVEVRFGPGLTQKAHRFLTPAGATSGVPDASYSYQDYVNVPFQVWNVTTQQQLMVSFRDQDRNGAFNLIEQNTTATDATQQGREYLYINNVPYSATTPNSSIAQTAGHLFQEMYFVWPVLTAGATWNPTSLPTSKLQILYSTLSKYSSTVKSVADVYADYDGINNSSFVHPDQHNIYPIKQNDNSQTYQLLLANDGGIFLSGISTSPGTTQGEWSMVGTGYNTSQFYGADKRPGAQEYLGGMQDNSTYYTPSGTVSSASTKFNTNIQLSGDGFEVLWHSLDRNKMIGGSQYNDFSRSLDGGNTWTSAISGLPLSGSGTDHSKFPFISKLANSKQAPDNIFTVGSGGVWRSTDFGGSWTLTPITQGWGLSSFTDVEVSRANPNIVWAGMGQSFSTTLFVSTNAGQTFSPVPNPVGYTLGNLSRIATHPTDPKTAYVLYSYAKTAKILKTTDMGQTWTDISGFGTGNVNTKGFPDVAVYSLYVRPDDTNIIWAGTEIGIVESLDGGASWAVLNEFPSLAVWDMKGQDKEIVIATHGRGIWTATLKKDQNGISKIIASGTSPQSKLKVVVNVPLRYDSVQLKINSKTVTFIPSDTGTYVLQVNNVSPGNLSMQTISYRGTLPVLSPPVTGLMFNLSAYQQKYYDYFVNANNFYLEDGFSIQPFSTSNSSLQSTHFYLSNKTYSATLLVPIIVSASNSTFVYDDVAIMQPGVSGSVFGQSAFNDYVIAEATKDGLNWAPISSGYNSSVNANWLSTFNASKSGNASMAVTENFDLKTNFHAGDTLLVRFRLFSNNDNTTAWGWSIDNLYIQQAPTEIATQPTDVTVYPNPSSGKFTINYSLSKESPVYVNLWDATGRNILSQDLGIQLEGPNRVEINLEGVADGVYLGRLKTSVGDKMLKIVVRK